MLSAFNNAQLIHRQGGIVAVAPQPESSVATQEGGPDFAPDSFCFSARRNYLSAPPGAL